MIFSAAQEVHDLLTKGKAEKIVFVSGFLLLCVTSKDAIRNS